MQYIYKHIYYYYIFVLNGLLWLNMSSCLYEHVWFYYAKTDETIKNFIIVIVNCHCHCHCNAYTLILHYLITFQMVILYFST